ncbi:enterobactin synthase subunit EntD [Enterobacter sp. ENT03]|uniref:enterobactin synthase subunit EntD n=1 Tax=Enterobacter sp. ENT03 TaxID=2854780 RepID=UPI001C461D6D|nr:enterobactin synthase subunit EntD [Enterobacter sp. ENT03]MBV7405248.1 enterobactin synthase subunit EntD [Enterobacter sp. ENT03]
MDYHHTTLPLAGLTLHRIDFDPTTWRDADLFWLPHHAQLRHTSPKRQREHLAGRLAAFHAMGVIPAIGANGAPDWPAGIFGSISHSGTTALAVVASQPVGVDIERCLDAALCAELADSIVDADERAVLVASGLPLPLAVTLAFSAKESLYKAFSDRALPWPGFASARVTALTDTQLRLTLSARFCPALAGVTVTADWCAVAQDVITLLSAD